MIYVQFENESIDISYYSLQLIAEAVTFYENEQHFEEKKIQI